MAGEGGGGWRMNVEMEEKSGGKEMFLCVLPVT